MGCTSVDGSAKLMTEYRAEYSSEIIPYGIRFSPDGKLICVATDKGRTVFDDQLVPNSVELYKPGTVPPTELDLSTKGFIASSTAGREGVISITEATSGDVVAELAGYRGVSWGPAGNLLAMEQDGFRLGVWDFAKECSLAVMDGHTGHIPAVAFSEDGRMIASGSGYGTIRIWDATLFRQVRAMRGHDGGIRHIAFWSEP